MVILLFEDSYEFIRNISSDLNRSTCEERPVILKDLKSDPDDPVGLIFRYNWYRY